MRSLIIEIGFEKIIYLGGQYEDAAIYFSMENIVLPTERDQNALAGRECTNHLAGIISLGTARDPNLFRAYEPSNLSYAYVRTERDLRMRI